VNCSYDIGNSISFSGSFNGANGYGWQTLKATCPEGQSAVLEERFTNLLPVFPLASGPENNDLVYWACNGTTTDTPDTYFVYIRGSGVYSLTEANSNIVCQIASIQPSLFVLNYTSTGDYFTLSESSAVAAHRDSPQFISILQAAFTALGDVFVQSQSGITSDIAESVVTAAKVTRNGSTTELPLLYSMMLKGMLEYEARVS